MRRSKKITAIVLLVVFAMGAIAFALFDGGTISTTVSMTGSVIFDNYGAVNVGRFLLGDIDVIVTTEDDWCFFDGWGTENALIFYPGANVEYTAYAPLMYKLAQNGVDCFLVKMPLNYAFLGIDKADDIIKSYSYDKWNLSGHSLGGAMISIYASTTKNKIDGLYLLASYPTMDVKNVNEVLYIYGDNDKVFSIDKIDSSIKYVPDNYRIFVIKGGNHAGFGSYGEQSGDGQATISIDEQIQQTVEQIILNK